MEIREKFPAHELACWLRYYREMGFTHLYKRESPPEPAARSENAPFGSLQPEAGRKAQPVPAGPPSPRTTEHSASTEFADDAESADSVEVLLPHKAEAGQSDLFAAVARRETLAEIREDLGDCRRCKLWEGRKLIVFGDGNPNAALAFVGEGPGADEDEQGLPFVGRAGQLLTDMIEKGMKLSRRDVYICNIIKCRPPGNRKPEKDEVAACRQFVERQLEAIRPQVICALGATAAETLLGVRESLGKLRGQWHEFRGMPLLVTYHPAFLLRDPAKKGEAGADLNKILTYLKSSPPASTRG